MINKVIETTSVIDNGLFPNNFYSNAEIPVFKLMKTSDIWVNLKKSTFITPIQLIVLTAP